MNIPFNVFGANETISVGKIVYTNYDKYYVVFDILNENTFVGINFHNYKEQAVILEVNDVVEVFELPKNANVFLFKKCEKIIEKGFENN